MKKNLTKLALSGAALAAVAATLGTSTYAWYTTNPTVNANNLKAGTSDTGASSIFISKDSTNPKTWSQTITFGDDDFSTSKLIPLSYDVQGKFSALTSSTGALADSATTTTDVLKATLYFKSSKVADDNPQSIYFKSISIQNTTTTLPTADNLAYDASAAAGDKVGGVLKNAATYSLDFRNALSMAVYNAGNYIATTVADADDFAAKKANLYTYDSTNSKYVSEKEGTYSATAKYFTLAGYDRAFTLGNSTYFNGTKDGTITSGADAQGYYDAVMETNLADGAKVAAGALTKTPIAVCPTNGTDYCTVDFYIYLDGASQWCYDACQGQTFAINLTFTSDAGVAIGA